MHFICTIDMVPYTKIHTHARNMLASMMSKKQVMISMLVISCGTASSVPGRESVAQVQVDLHLGSVWSCQGLQR